MKNKNLILLAALFALGASIAVLPLYAQARHYGFGTATSTAAAATINQTGGAVVTESLTTAALTDYTFTLTNSTIETVNAVVVVSLGAYTGTGTPIVQKVAPAAGSCVITIRNQHATAALNSTLKFTFAVLSP